MPRTDNRDEEEMRMDRMTIWIQNVESEYLRYIISSGVWLTMLASA